MTDDSAHTSVTGHPDVSTVFVDGLINDITALQDQITRLQQTMTTRPVIDQAKGMLMAAYGIDSETAFAVLTRWSQDLNVKVRVVAQTMVSEAKAAESAGLRPTPAALTPGTIPVPGAPPSQRTG